MRLDEEAKPNCSLYFITVLRDIFIPFSFKIFVNCKQLAKLFVSNVAVTNVVSHYFLIVSIGYVLYTITSCYLGTLNGIGKPTKSMILMIFYYIIIRIPFAYLLSWLAENLNGVWIAILISHIVACIITILTSNQIIKRLYGKLYDRTKKARYKSIESNCCGKF